MWNQLRRLIVACSLVLACSAGACGEESRPRPAQDALGATLAEALRIDISELEITYDYWPSDSRIQGSAVMRFEMRPGQRRPLFHFNPLRRGLEPAGEMLLALELDGEELDPYSEEDVLRIRPGAEAEPALELQRELAEGEPHVLRVSWSVPNRRPPKYPDWFYANFDDTIGPHQETETLWPTISSPEELARHRIHLRVHSGRPFTVLGSGPARRRRDAEVQTWDLDTEESVASHTVLFAAVPSEDVRSMRFQAGDVDVRIVSDRPTATTKRARRITRKTIAQLVADFGPFPMPRMQILLTGWSGGMEYFGATRTGIGALEHELAHMYFGASAVNRTWRDTWIDEAAVVWWQEQNGLQALRPGFSSRLADGRTAVEPGFDQAAYGAGARVLGEVATGLGGSAPMIEFLADLHERRAGAPFTTEELIEEIVSAQDDVDRTDLERWLYGGRRR